MDDEMDLFEQARQEQIEREAPLAARMRPRTLDEFVGQEHVVGPGRLLRRAIQADQISSLIFYGPPGTGKTTLARIIANTTHSRFVTLNAVLAGVAQLREVVAEAREQRTLYGRRTILFVDEVHRWNKAQQDSMLPWVENGAIVMIGATTENPWFSVNPPLLSRSRVFQLVPLTDDALRAIAHAALTDRERGYGALCVRLEQDALEHLVRVASGDARSLLNALELAVETTAPDGQGVITVDMAVAEESIQQRAVLYDREGDYHFDTISAFIKSLRGSDPDAALYWLAKMVHAGEDPRFVLRRMLILASEDVGLADPQALVVVQAAADAFERVGLPEGQFHLTQAALYLATTAKSNTTMGYFDALEAVKAEQRDQVPTHLKDASRDKEGFGHGEGYRYPHAYRDHWVEQQYLPDALRGQVFYRPSDQGYERSIRERVEQRREAQLAAALELAAPAREALTFSPEDRAVERWLARTVDSTARGLAETRERLFAPLDVQRHHLVLDLGAGSGLLTWEALRRAPEGGVWALEAQHELAQALLAQAAQLPELLRPTVLEGEIEALPELLAQAGHPKLFFDLIIGRNALTRSDTWQSRLALLRTMLAAVGRISLAEVVPSGGQRLYALEQASALDPGLRERWAVAEDALYGNPADFVVNWGPNDLEAALALAGFRRHSITVHTTHAELLVSRGQVERWFAPQGSQPARYLSALQACLTTQEIAQIEALLRRTVAGQVIPWQRTVAFVLASQEA